MLSYDQALSYSLVGDVVYIIGSGFSTLAKDIENNYLPTGSQFANELCTALSIKVDSIPDDLPLELAAQEYIDFIGEKSLINLIKKRFSVSLFNECYNSFARIKKAHIYTTNYDNLIEIIFDKGRKIKTYNILSELNKVNKEHFILHINGYAHNLEDSIDNNSFRLTYGSYDKILYDSPWYKYLRDDIRSKSAIFIIGLSFKSDLDLRRILSDDSEIRNKCFFIERPDLSDTDKRYLSRYGTVLVNGVEKYFHDLNKAIPAESINDITKYRLKSFVDLSAKNRLIYQEATDNDIFNMFFLGNNDNSLFFQDANERFVNLINRESLTLAKEKLLNGDSIIIHSDLGNGKTMFLHQLTYCMRDRSFYLFKNFTNDWEKELDLLCKDEANKIIVFETYNLCYDQIKYVINHSENNKIQLVLLARTAMHENCENSIYQMLSAYKITEIDLNILKINEINELNNLLMRYGLWSEYSSESHDERAKIIRRDCNSSLCDLILLLFKDCELKGRFENLINEIDRNAQKLLTLSFINDALELKLLNDDYEIIIDDSRRILRSGKFREFTFRDRNELKVKSSIIAKALLSSKSIGQQNVLRILTELSCKLDDLYIGNKKYDNAMRNLGTYSYLSFLFDYETDKNIIINYYENIKELKFNTKNLFFWEQYAIACVHTKEFNRAEIYFKTAYALAKNRRAFSTFQIDNHYARFLLEKVIYARDYEHAYASFIEAHKLITAKNTINLNDKYYQFRVARSYKGIFDIFYSDFTDEQKKAFVDSCKEIQINLNKYKKENQQYNRRDVNECEQNLYFILNNIAT